MPETKTTKTATFVKSLTGFAGTAKLYNNDPKTAAAAVAAINEALSKAGAL